MPVCRFFVRGSCNRGDSCRFDHVLPDEDFGESAGRGGAEFDNSAGTSVLKRDSSSYSGSSSYNDRSYYSEPKPQSVYKKYNDRTVQGTAVTFNNDYYHTPPNKQYDQQQYYAAQKYPNDRFHYDSRQSKQQQQYSQKAPEISIEELYTLVKSEIYSIEKGRKWPLTSFSIVKLFGSLDDWYDYSPEELRLAAYLAKANNNFEGYKGTLDKIVNRAEAIREFYKNISNEATAKLKEYTRQPPGTVFPLVDNELDFSRINCSSINLLSSPSEFGSVETSILADNFQQASEDTEMSQSAPKTDSVFGSHSSVPNIDFGSVKSPSSTSIFGGMQQDNKSTNVFGGFSQQVNQGVPFGSSQKESSSFGFASQNKSSFGDFQGPRDLKVIFPSLNNTDLDLKILSFVWHGDSPYSQKNELTPEELEQFTASEFTIGKVPLVPPPRELC